MDVLHARYNATSALAVRDPFEQPSMQTLYKKSGALYCRTCCNVGIYADGGHIVHAGECTLMLEVKNGIWYVVGCVTDFQVV